MLEPSNRQVKVLLADLSNGCLVQLIGFTIQTIKPSTKIHTGLPISSQTTSLPLCLEAYQPGTVVECTMDQPHCGEHSFTDSNKNINLSFLFSMLFLLLYMGIIF